MSKKLLLGIVVVLLITNIGSLLFLNKGENITIDENSETKLSSQDSVATVGKEEISYKQWMDALRNSQGKNKLKSMIDRTVVNQLAEENKIEISDKMVERELAFLMTMQGIMTEEEIAKEEERLRKDIVYRYQLQELLAADDSIPEGELQAYYDNYGDQYNFTASMQLSHILVDDFETADKVVAELDAGASFDLLAKEYSKDEESKNNGGYLGFVYTSSQFLPTSYEEKANEMENHSYSEPLQAENGIAVLYLHRKLPAIEFTYEEIKPYMESEMILQNRGQSLKADPLWEQLDVEWIYGK